MTTIEIARRMARLGETESALKAYEIVTTQDSEPAELLEAAAYILDNGGDYKISYTTFIGLYSAGYFREQILPLMTKAFYEPNVKLLKSRYERNVKLLNKYPYLFRKDFLPFDELPLVFFPYDDHNGYVPFDAESGAFRDFLNVKDPVVSRNFFKDLEKPILASDVYSQYELEYLVDNVRPGEWVGRENHIYLHYTDWAEFCSWLTVLTMKPLLTEHRKIVFLIGDELSQYPIDFKARFGIDYSKYPVRPVGIREINKLIWHTQLSSHNGGDFFNEIFDGHPNLLCLSSVMLDEFEQLFDDILEDRKRGESLQDFTARFPTYDDKGRVAELYALKNPTKKDLLIFRFLAETAYTKSMDPASRIAPAVFFQPHFGNIVYELSVDEQSGKTTLWAEEAEAASNSAILNGFKYIKTFTPLRRFTSSYGGTVRFMCNQVGYMKTETGSRAAVVPDVISERILNRSYLRDPDDRLYHDACVVRFEDGKLNPEATFTRLAAFLDVPYTESMTYCSLAGERDPLEFDTNVRGFDPATVYNTYDAYCNDTERAFIEYFLRDAYAYYGYNFQWYDGAPVDEARADAWIDGFTTLDGFIHNSFVESFGEISGMTEEDERAIRGMLGDDTLKIFNTNRHNTVHLLLQGLYFINRRGQPLQMTPMLEPDPALLDQPLYH